MSEYEPQQERRPLKGLTEEELNYLLADLQDLNRENARLYGVIMQERTYRYVERLRRDG
jgi:hypothetical protein